ncbi:MAG: hypothetical protein FJ267_03650 [Planctomycetes bacterium]|nr:hypothetical protein [Planctomycetota bacterium]
MFWEILAGSRFSIAMTFIGSNLYLGLIYPLLWFSVGPEAASELKISPSIYLAIVVLSVFSQGAAVLEIPKKQNRLFVFPITTQSIVGWQLLISMVIGTLLNIAGTLSLNILLGLDWPILGPALFTAASIAAAAATIWATENSSWQPLAVGTVIGLLILFFLSRLGPVFGSPQHTWEHVTLFEWIFLLGTILVSYRVAVWGMSRNRCGEAFASFDVDGWIRRLWFRTLDKGFRFRSPVDAQLWYEWKQKGWIFVCILVLMLLGSFVASCAFLVKEQINDDTFSNLLLGFLFGAIFSFTAFGVVIGTIIGIADSNQSKSLTRFSDKFEIGHFLSTLPITDEALAGLLLRIMGTMALLTWGIWIAILTFLYASLSIVGYIPAYDSLTPALATTGIVWWYIPFQLIVLWTTQTFMATIVLTGRKWFPITIYFGAIGIALLVTSTSGLLGQEEGQRLREWSVISLALSTLIVVGVMLWMARKREFVSTTAIGTSLGIWLLLVSSVAIFHWTYNPDIPAYMSAAVLSLITAAVAPIATAPLALSWNRHR